MKTYTFNIQGMTCHACESLITMDLEEAGLPEPKEIHADSGVMVIEIDENQVNAVKAVVASSEKYSVESVTEHTV